MPDTLESRINYPKSYLQTKGGMLSANDDARM